MTPYSYIYITKLIVDDQFSLEDIQLSIMNVLIIKYNTKIC